MLLASIVWQTHSDCKTGYYHAPEGTTPKLPADHQSRASNLLRNHSRLGDLQNLVRCGYAEDFGTSAQQSVPTLTGISPHVNVLRQNAIMLAEQKRMHGLLVELRENLPSQIARDVRDEIDTFSQEQGNITLTTLQSFQSTLLDKIDGLNGVGSSSNATGAGGVVGATKEYTADTVVRQVVSSSSRKLCPSESQVKSCVQYVVLKHNYA